MALKVVPLVVLVTLAGACGAIDAELDLEDDLRRHGFTSVTVMSEGVTGRAGRVNVSAEAPRAEIRGTRSAEVAKVAWTTYEYRFDELRVRLRIDGATERRRFTGGELEAAHGARPSTLDSRSVTSMEDRLGLMAALGLLAGMLLLAVAGGVLAEVLVSRSRRRGPPISSWPLPTPAWSPTPASPAPWRSVPSRPPAGPRQVEPIRRQPPPPPQRRPGPPIWAGWTLIGCGTVLVLLAAVVTVAQRGDPATTATVLDARCNEEHDPLARQTATRCTVEVEFTARDGTLVRAKLGNASPEEIRQSGDKRVLDVRYDPSDPQSIFTKSDHMPVGIFIAFVLGGVVLVAIGVLAVRRARSP